MLALQAFVWYYMKAYAVNPQAIKRSAAETKGVLRYERLKKRKD